MNIETLFPLAFSHSMLSDLHRCEVYWFRSHVQKFSTEKNSDLIAGGLFASACEIVRRGFFEQKLDIDEAIELGYNSILEGEDTGDSLKSNDRIGFLLKKYFKQFPPDESWKPIQLSDGSYSIEYEFIFDTGIQHPDLPDRNIHFKGKLDLLGQKRIAGGRIINAVLDEKTTKSVKRVPESKVIDLAAEERSYLSDGQLIAYAWAAKQLGVNVEMAYIRRVPILTNYEPAFELEIPVTSFMIENWSKSTFNRIAELAERYKFYKKTNDIFDAFSPVYNSGCNAYNKPCKYKMGCIQKEGEEFIAQNFQQIVFLQDTQETLTLRKYKERLGL